VDPEPPVHRRGEPAGDAPVGRQRSGGREAESDSSSADNAPKSRQQVAREQFSAFYRSHFTRLIAQIRYLGADERHAYDIAQDSMLDALQSWEKIAHPEAWIRTTARRKYFKHAYRVEEASFDDLADNISSLVRSPQEDVDADDHIVSLVGRLPPRQRVVMALHLEGLTPSEIASEIDASSDQVSANLLHAKNALRRYERRDREQGRRP